MTIGKLYDSSKRECNMDTKQLKNVDFLKQTLYVGDKCVAALNHGRNSGASLMLCEILGETPKFLNIKSSKYNMEYRISPDKVAKIQQQ